MTQIQPKLAMRNKREQFHRKCNQRHYNFIIKNICMFNRGSY